MGNNVDNDFKGDFSNQVQDLLDDSETNISHYLIQTYLKSECPPYYLLYKYLAVLTSISAMRRHVFHMCIYNIIFLVYKVTTVVKILLLNSFQKPL